MTRPSPTTPAYDLLGGDAALQRLVDRFYDLMDAVLEYHVIRKLHPQDLAGSREKLRLFLSGWLGGPQLYVEKFGHPMPQTPVERFAPDRAQTLGRSAIPAASQHNS